MTVEGKMELSEESATELIESVREGVIADIEKFGLRVCEVTTAMEKYSPTIYLRVIKDTIDHMSEKLNRSDSKSLTEREEYSKIEAIRHIMNL